MRKNICSFRSGPVISVEDQREERKKRVDSYREKEEKEREREEQPEVIGVDHSVLRM